MKNFRVAELELKAKEILTAFGAFEVPVPLELVAHRIGLAVDQVPLGDDISGVLVVTGDKGSIGVNRDHPEPRRRFTVAHEIGHFVLHRSQRDLFIDKSFVAFRDTTSSAGIDRAEIQANQFAAALLMPAALVQQELRRHAESIVTEDVIDRLAERFEVSSQAMMYRLINLKLI